MPAAAALCFVMLKFLHENSDFVLEQLPSSQVVHFVLRPPDFKSLNPWRPLPFVLGASHLWGASSLVVWPLLRPRAFSSATTISLIAASPHAEFCSPTLHPSLLRAREILRLRLRPHAYFTGSSTSCFPQAPRLLRPRASCTAAPPRWRVGLHGDTPFLDALSTSHNKPCLG